MKILSIHDLATIRKKAEHNLLLREESNEKVTDYPPVHSIFRYLSAEVQVVKHLPVKVLRTIF